MIVLYSGLVKGPSRDVSHGKQAMRRFGRILGWSLALPLLAVVILLFGFRVAALMRESADIAALAPPGRTIETSLGRIFVQERGPETGQPVLLVPGTAAWGGFWIEVMENLGAAGYRAIAVDMPPFGFSEHRPQADYGRVEQAERLKAVIDRLPVRSRSWSAILSGRGPSWSLRRGMVARCAASSWSAARSTCHRARASIRSPIPCSTGSCMWSR